MRHRIRAAGLLFNGDSILLVLHRDEIRSVEFWIPPGGGLIQGDRSIFDAARREIFEETGLIAEVCRISHIREFRDIDNQIHHIEFFMPVESYFGHLTIANVPEGDEDQKLIKSVQWVNRAELHRIPVYPEWLASDLFWQEAHQNFPSTRYTEAYFGSKKFR